MMFSPRSLFAIVLLLATPCQRALGAVQTRGLLSSTYSKTGYCEIGNSCKNYCEGWHDSKQLYYITSCPKEEKGKGRCKAMECTHTSESEADTEGCFCCCGDDPVPEAVFYGPGEVASEQRQYIQLPRAGYTEMGIGDDMQYITQFEPAGHKYTPGVNGCTVGGGCRSYCEGWHKSKELFFITSCPVPRRKRDDDDDDDDYKDSCMDMKCKHTSKSRADTDGCYCCCGNDPVTGATFHGPNSALQEIAGDRFEKMARLSDTGIHIVDQYPPQSPCFEDTMGRSSGMAACEHVVATCLQGADGVFNAPPVDQSIAMLHHDTCSENEKAICIVSGRRFQSQIDPRCASATNTGLGRCSPAAAQAMYQQLLEFYCGA